jgi:hypothetical protein
MVTHRVVLELRIFMEYTEFVVIVRSESCTFMYAASLLGEAITDLAKLSSQHVSNFWSSNKQQKWLRVHCDERRQEHFYFTIGCLLTWLFSIQLND